MVAFVNGLQNVAMPACCHFFFPDHGEPFNVGEVFDGELGVFPHRAGFPAVEAGPYRTARAIFRSAERAAQTREQSARNLLLPASR